MPNQSTIRNYYLKKLAEYRKAGYTDSDAAEAAAKDTKAKYGKVPG